jgi:hypothetical protein
MSTEAIDQAVIAVRQSAGRLQRAIRARQRCEDAVKAAQCDERMARHEHEEAKVRLVQMAGGVNEWGLSPAESSVQGLASDAADDAARTAYAR